MLYILFLRWGGHAAFGKILIYPIRARRERLRSKGERTSYERRGR
ncbi:MAG: hypothetical protein ACLR8Y_00105 [Alistipes indistinctus]